MKIKKACGKLKEAIQPIAKYRQGNKCQNE